MVTEQDRAPVTAFPSAVERSVTRIIYANGARRINNGTVTLWGDTAVWGRKWRLPVVTFSEEKWQVGGVALGAAGEGEVGGFGASWHTTSCCLSRWVPLSAGVWWLFTLTSGLQLPSCQSKLEGEVEVVTVVRSCLKAQLYWRVRECVRSCLPCTVGAYGRCSPPAMSYPSLSLKMAFSFRFMFFS